MLSRLLRVSGPIALAAGSALCAIYMLARVDSVLGHDADLARFAIPVGPPDQSLWSEARVR
jgi:hypothetical protein